MDLLSLPDEMLASVTKYMHSAPCRSSRRLNKRMNLLAKSFGLDRMYIDRMELKSSFEEPFQPKLILESENQVLCALRRPDNTTIERLFNMVRKVDTLDIVVSSSIQNRLTEFYRLAKGIRVRSLNLCCLEGLSKPDHVINFANDLKPSKVQIQFHYKVHHRNISDKLVASFDPSINLQFHGITEPEKMTISSFRSRVLANKLMFSVDEYSTTAMTFNDMIQFLKEYNMLESNMHFGIIDQEEDIYESTVMNKLKECGFIVLRHVIGKVRRYPNNRRIYSYSIARPGNSSKIKFRIWINAN